MGCATLQMACTLRTRCREGPSATGFRSGRWCRFCSRYLSFYKHTMDLLIRNGIVSSQEAMLPVVSAAISHLWQNLSEDRKTSLLQAWAQEHSGLTGLLGARQESACTEGSMKDSGVDSQGASCSLVSSPEEVSSPRGVGWRATQDGWALPPQARRHQGPACPGSFGKFEMLFGSWLTRSISDFPDIIMTREQHFFFY